MHQPVEKIGIMSVSKQDSSLEDEKNSLYVSGGENHWDILKDLGWNEIFVREEHIKLIAEFQFP